MGIYSWLLTLISLSVLPIQILLTFLGVPLFKNQYRKVAESNAKTQNHLIESINGIQTIKTQNIENLTFKKWNKNYFNFIQKIFSKTITETVLSESSNLLQKISQIMVLWIGASLVLNGKLSLGQLIAFRIISSYVTQPILRLSTLSQRFQELKVSFERLGDVLNRKTESGINNYENINIPKIKGNIQINNLDFYYENNENKILENVNFKLKANTFTGIVGRSGSGKSTLVKLLARLYKPSKGEIIIDDYDIQKVELYSFRKQIGFVSQDPYLVSGSILENISIGNPEASKEDIIRVSKDACAHEFIMNLKDGYKTIIEEKGNSLSGGQKQRIAIARALLGNPSILILDEGTSALDYITEKKVLENIKKMTNNTSIIFVTHRFQNLKDIDQILFLKNGQLMERGSHSELIDKKGLYFSMFNEI
jgi:ATP-binding cassette subfamily B protein